MAGVAAGERARARRAASTRPKGRRKTLVGKVTPRIYTPPLVTGPPGPCGCGCALTPETSLGFDVVDFSSSAVNVDMFPWQRWLLIHLLELRDDGTLRFRKAVVLVARQNGKSLLAEILALYFMYALRAKLVLGTAQDLSTAEDVWEDTLDLATESDFLRPHLTKPKFGKGGKEFGLVDRGLYRVKAANRRGGRGARQAKLVLLDELREHQSWDAWGAITKTTNAVPEAMVLALSNAGDATSVVLRYLRLMAHKKLGDPDGIVADSDPAALIDQSDNDVEEEHEEDDSLAIFEWSAEPGADVRDRDAWAQANPSLPHTLTERTLLSDVSVDPEWVFRTECLCQWSDGSLTGPFPNGKWEAGRVQQEEADLQPIMDDQPVACIEVSNDRSRAAVVYAGHRPDGLPMGEVVFYRYDPQMAIEWLSSDDREVTPRAIAVRKTGPASSLVKDLEDAGFNVVLWSGTEVSDACGRLYDAVRGNEDDPCGDLRHAAHTALDVAAATAATNPYGDKWSWDMAKSPTDISPLYALTGAYWLLDQPSEEPLVSAYETRGVMTI